MRGLADADVHVPSLRMLAGAARWQVRQHICHSAVSAGARAHQEHI
jgi:hypothetical protein